MDEVTPNGIEYEFWIVSSQGAAFELRPRRGEHSREDLRIAKKYLRNMRDVVQLWVRWRGKDGQLEKKTGYV